MRDPSYMHQQPKQSKHDFSVSKKTLISIIRPISICVNYAIHIENLYLFKFMDKQASKMMKEESIANA